MSNWIARPVGVVSAIILGIGLANIGVPFMGFPSRITCITDWDTIMCTHDSWVGAWWMVLMGAVGIACALVVLRHRGVDFIAAGDATR